MSITPRYRLTDVFDLVRAGGEKVWFSCPSRSIDQVIEVCLRSGQQLSLQEAQAFVLNGILALKGEDFVGSLIMWNDKSLIADVYGVIFDGRAWYVKFMIEDGILDEISFHPPEKPLKLANGKVIS